MDKEEIFAFMFNLFEEIRAFLNKQKEKNLNLEFSMLKKPYPVTTYELLFNILIIN